MVRMLHIVGSMSPSGIGNFIMNSYRHIDRNKVQFDFIVHEHREVSFDDEIMQMGGKLFYVTRKSINPIKNFLEMKKIVQEGGYQIVFRHTDTATVALDLWAAKLGSAKIRIPHSHSTNTSNVKMHRLFQPILNAVSTNCFACSKSAGEWLYGHDDFEVILNGINAKQFVYSKEVREQVRDCEGIANKLVFGHIGNFLPVKNHSFMLDIFASIVKQCPEAVLVFVGDGILRDTIEKKAEELGIIDSIRFLGVRKDTDKLLQAMDLFLFPSHYEGMPIALVEAQAAGLPCLISESITDDVILTDLVTKMQLPGENKAEEWSVSASKAMIEKWAGKALKLARETVRSNTMNWVYKSGFTVEQLAERYEKLAEEAEKE